MKIARASIVLAFIAAAGCSAAALNDADIGAIRALHDRVNAMELANKWTSIPSAFADDAVIIPADAPPIKGIEAIRNFYSNLQIKVTELKPELATVEGAGNVGYLRAAVRSVIQVPGGRTITDTTAYIWLLRRVGEGEWKITEVAGISRYTFQNPGR